MRSATVPDTMEAMATQNIDCHHVVHFDDAVIPKQTGNEPVAGWEHDAVAGQDERRRGNRKQTNVLGALCHDAFVLNVACLDHRKARRHPHDKHAAKDDKQGVHDKG